MLIIFSFLLALLIWCYCDDCWTAGLILSWWWLDCLS